MFISLIRAVACGTSLFRFRLSGFSCVNMSQFLIHSLADGRFHCFPFLAAMNKSDVNIFLTSLFVNMCFCFT